jgi:hypothetical protein
MSLTVEQQEQMINGEVAFEADSDSELVFTEANALRFHRGLPMFPKEWLGNWPNPFPDSWKGLDG